MQVSFLSPLFFSVTQPVFMQLYCFLISFSHLLSDALTALYPVLSKLSYFIYRFLLFSVALAAQYLAFSFDGLFSLLCCAVSFIFSLFPLSSLFSFPAVLIPMQIYLLLVSLFFAIFFLLFRQYCSIAFSAAMAALLFSNCFFSLPFFQLLWLLFICLYIVLLSFFFHFLPPPPPPPGTTAFSFILC